MVTALCLHGACFRWVGWTDVDDRTPQKQKRQQGCWRYTVEPTKFQVKRYFNSTYLSNTI